MESKLELIKKMLNELNEDDYEIEFSEIPVITEHYSYDNKKRQGTLHEIIRYERCIVIRDKTAKEIRKVW